MPIVLAVILLFLVLAGVLFVRCRNRARAFYDRYRNATMCTGESVLYLSDPYTGARLRPSVSFWLKREFTGEHLYTNDRGERVAESGQKARPRRVLLAGDSFALGSGVDHEDSLGGILAQEHGLDLANAAVGTASLLQIVRRVEQSLPFHHPRVVVLVFNHGLVDRCFKLNAFLKGLGQRPVYAYHKGTGKPGIRENLWSPPTWVFQAIHSSRKRLIDDHAFGLPDVFHYARMRFFMRLMEKVRAAVKLFRNARYRLVDESLYLDRGMRDMALKDCLGRLKGLIAEHDARVLFYQMFEYRAYENRAEVIRGDMELVRALAEDEPRLAVAGCEDEKERMDAYLAERGFAPGDYRGGLVLPDDIHYHRDGNAIMAAAVHEALARHGLLETGN